jgi:hypothetical protein
MLIQEIKKRLKNAQERKEKPIKTNFDYEMINHSIGIYTSLLRVYEDQPCIEEVLAERCNEYMNKELIGWTKVLRGEEENPFPIGKTALENLIWKKQLSLAQQVKLAEFFGLTLKITIE